MKLSAKLKTVWKYARTGFRNVLRFFNLLEPDLPYMVLSLSKISVYMTLGLSIYVVVGNKGTVEVAGALMSNLGSIANYAYRRHKQVQTRTAGYGMMNQFEPESDDDNMGGMPMGDMTGLNSPMEIK